MWDETACDGVRNPMSNGNPISNGAPAGRGGKVCGARTRAGGECQARPCANGRCKVHGGLTPGGLASPKYKTGKHSKYLRGLPKELGKAYREALNDEELISLRNEIAMTQAFYRCRLAELLEVEAPPWGKVITALSALEQSPSDPAALAGLATLLRAGASAAAKERDVREDVRELMQEKGKLAAAEWKRLNDIRAVVPVAQAVLFGQMVVGMVFELFGRDSRVAELQRRLAALAPTVGD
jgi:hypothetical protein